MKLNQLFQHLHSLQCSFHQCGDVYFFTNLNNGSLATLLAPYDTVTEEQLTVVCEGLNVAAPEYKFVENKNTTRNRFRPRKESGEARVTMGQTDEELSGDLTLKVGERSLSFDLGLNTSPAFSASAKKEKENALPYLINQPASIAPVNKLSKREAQVLALICQEYSTVEIAEELYISRRTVEGYRSRLLEKCGAKNIVGLVIYAIQHEVVAMNFTS